MASGAKPWSSLLLVAVAAVMLIAAKPTVAAPGPAPGPAASDDPYCSSNHLPDECAADEFSNCNYVPYPFSVIWPSCSLEAKARACCDALRTMSEHRCATCALLKELDAVPQFDPTQCRNGVEGPAKECKDLCTKNPDDAKCKF